MDTGYKKIKVHLVYAVKHDSSHKARCIADGYLMDVPVDSVYSSVISLPGLSTIVLLAQLNNLEIWRFGPQTLGMYIYIYIMVALKHLCLSREPEQFFETLVRNICIIP